MYTNTSIVDDESTASTLWEVAKKRSDNLAFFGIKSVLELCVGPSLKTLEEAYAVNDISVVGNDIDKRWQRTYPKGNWLIGNCFDIEWKQECVVFAPPLSAGCTGTREDSLSIDEVFPKYSSFLAEWIGRDSEFAVLVLPGRSLATRSDRQQYYRLMSDIYQLGIHPQPIDMTAGHRRIRKYIDVYIQKP